MKKFMNLIFVSVVAIGSVVLLSDSALANKLDKYRNEGLVKETSSGYLMSTGGDAKVQAFVDETNAKRKAKYTEVAEKNGTSVEAAAQIAAQKLMSK